MTPTQRHSKQEVAEAYGDKIANQDPQRWPTCSEMDYQLAHVRSASSQWERLRRLQEGIRHFYRTRKTLSRLAWQQHNRL